MILVTNPTFFATVSTVSILDVNEVPESAIIVLI
jgi:hypothetical protein